MDWADEIAAGLSPIERRCDTAVCVYQHQCMCAAYIAAALRKAKADGMKEAADLMQEWPAKYQPDRAGLYIRASQIEKGN